MLSTLSKTAFMAFMANHMVSAQTSSDCNPVEGDTCDPNPAFGDDEVTIDFTSGASEYFTEVDGTNVTYDGTNGAVFSISSEADAPTIVSTNYLFFGRVDCVIQAAPGTGIVTSFTLQSDDLDEIDWEWVGVETEYSQSNYFSKGDTSTYDRGDYHDSETVTTEFHTYSIEWTTESIQWIIDDETVRTLEYADADDGASYPQTPMQVRLGSWVGGSSEASDGTIEWAGGLATFDDAPYYAYYQSITIQDYANGVDGAVEYVYSDDSGLYDSIEVNTESTSTSTSNSTTTATNSTATSSATDTDTLVGDSAGAMTLPGFNSLLAAVVLVLATTAL